MRVHHLSNICELLWMSQLVLGKQAQFYDNDADYGLALSSSPGVNGTDLYLQISGPTSHEWAAAGTGDRMDGSLMFIIYPSGDDNDVTLSIQSAGGHDTPNTFSGFKAELVNSDIQNGRMSATIRWSLDRNQKWNKVSSTSKKQPWIWAIGPSQALESKSTKAEIDQHSSHGIIFTDMTATQNAVTTLPQISSTANAATKVQGRSYRALVVLHALLLSIAFVVIFPLGVIGLRWKWSVSFGAHWFTQSIASLASFVGLALAIALSIVGVEYDEFDEGHQILGICTVALLVIQTAGGYLHHLRFKSLGRRTTISYAHMWLGRIVIYGGMVNAILGFVLNGSTGLAIGCAIVSLVFACALEIAGLRFRRRRDAFKKGLSSTIELADNNGVEIW